MFFAEKIKTHKARDIFTCRLSFKKNNVGHFPRPETSPPGPQRVAAWPRLTGEGPPAQTAATDGDDVVGRQWTDSVIYLKAKRAFSEMS